MTKFFRGNPRILIQALPVAFGMIALKWVYDTSPARHLELSPLLTGVIAAEVFIVGWAVALLAVAAWAVKANRRWVVNLAAVFGAIHFYTQWFERLGATPVSVLVGGVLVLAFAVVAWKLNHKAEAMPAAA